jgi:hypothetical protein
VLTFDSAVFQAGGLIVVLVEVGRKAYLASIVPVIVNAILNEHQIVVDIVAFVNRGDFPRSRLGEKQRGKILASWVTRKMRTMAQFGIRDADSALSDVTETMEPRSGITSLKNGSVIASSLRNVESAPQIIEDRDFERQQVQSQNSFAPLPTGISEMPAINYNDSIVGSPTEGNGASTKSDDTPTDNRKGHFELPTHDFGSEKQNFPDGKGSFEIPGFSTAEPPDVTPPRVGPKPMSPHVNLPAVEGREGDIWTLPSQQPRGGLRVQNAHSDDEADNWKNDAIMHMNLAGR